MATISAPTMDSDNVLTFDINAGTLLQFLESRAEGGPRLKCFEGSVTLVSPGRSHELSGRRIGLMVPAVGSVLGIRSRGLKSSTLKWPRGVGDTAYEPDESFSIQGDGREEDHQPPDLAIEVVISNPATKTLRAGELLKIPELWVLDIPNRRLTFYRLATRGKLKGAYRPSPRSRAFPVLTPADVLKLLDDPETDDYIFLERCRDWTRDVLLPRLRAEEGGA